MSEEKMVQNINDQNLENVEGGISKTSYEYRKEAFEDICELRRELAKEPWAMVQICSASNPKRSIKYKKCNICGYEEYKSSEWNKPCPKCIELSKY